MLLGSSLTDEIKQAFMDAFRELPQRVLWKYENETLPGKPDNVMVRKWMPQFDILSEFNSTSSFLPTLKLFKLTHSRSIIKEK